MSISLSSMRRNGVPQFYVRKIFFFKQDKTNARRVYGKFAYVRSVQDHDELDDYILAGVRRQYLNAKFLKDRFNRTRDNDNKLKSFLRGKKSYRISGFDLSLTTLGFDVNNPIQRDIQGKEIPLNIYSDSNNNAKLLAEPHFAHVESGFTGDVQAMRDKIDNTICDYKTFLNS